MGDTSSEDETTEEEEWAMELEQPETMTSQENPQVNGVPLQPPP